LHVHPPLLQVFVLPVHCELDVQVAHPDGSQVCPEEQAGLPLQVHEPLAHVFAAPMQSLEEQQPDDGMHVPSLHFFWPDGQEQPLVGVHVWPDPHAAFPLQVHVPELHVSVVPVQSVSVQHCDSGIHMFVPHAFVPEGHWHPASPQTVPPAHAGCAPQLQSPPSPHTLLVPVHCELEVHAEQPPAMQVSPALHAGTPLHSHVPETHVFALLPQSASMQQSVVGMHDPLQSLVPAMSHELTRASCPPSMRGPEPLPELGLPLSWPVDVPVSVVPSAALPSTPPVDEPDAHPTAKAAPKATHRTQRRALMTPPLSMERSIRGLAGTNYFLYEPTAKPGAQVSLEVRTFGTPLDYKASAAPASRCRYWPSRRPMCRLNARARASSLE